MSSWIRMPSWAVLIVAGSAMACGPQAPDASSAGAAPASAPKAPGALPGFLVVHTAEVDGAIVPHELMEVPASEAAYAHGRMPSVASDFYWTPTVEEVTAAQRRVRAAMFAAADGEMDGVLGDAWPPALRASAPQAVREIVAAWNDYRVQYLGIVVSGRRRILCNVFPKADAVGTSGGRWQRFWVDSEAVLDGGSAYWRITYDVEDDACLGFDSNGNA